MIQISDLETTNSIDQNKFQNAIDLFNSTNWYLAHDAFEELWYETQGLERITIQALLQIAVAQVHLETGNKNGATILFGEALGRLRKGRTSNLGLDIDNLTECVKQRLNLLHQENDPDLFTVPFLFRLT